MSADIVDYKLGYMSVFIVPYLTSKLKLEDHNDNCKDPFRVKRLYIRDYTPGKEWGEKGEQKLVPYGITCLSCNKIIREYKDSKRILPQVVISKLQRQRRKLLGKEHISPKENGYRQRIKGYNELYSPSYYKNDKLKINWDMTLVQRFLAIRPTIAELHRVIYSSPLRRYDKTHRYIYPTKSDPERVGRIIWDHKRYDELHVKEAKIRMRLMNEIIEHHKHNNKGEELTILTPLEKNTRKLKRD